MPDIQCLFSDILAIWNDVVPTQDLAFALLDHPVPSQALPHDLFRIPSLRAVFLSVPVFPVSSACEVSASEVSPVFARA